MFSLSLESKEQEDGEQETEDGEREADLGSNMEWMVLWRWGGRGTHDQGKAGEVVAVADSDHFRAGLLVSLTVISQPAVITGGGGRQRRDEYPPPWYMNSWPHTHPWVAIATVNAGIRLEFIGWRL